MTPKQQQMHKHLIQQVHLSQRYQSYFKEHRDEYKELLLDAFGKQSSKDLSVASLILLVDYLNYKRDALPQFVTQRCSNAQVWKIKTTWEQKARVKTDEALLKFCEKITKKTYQNIEALDASEAKKILIALQNLR